MQHIIPYLVLCTFLVSGTFATETTTYGTVQDKETRLPLAGVLVTSLSSGDTQTTDSTGRFLLPVAGIRSDRIALTNNNAIRWNSSTNTLDISKAPDLVLLRLFSINGRCLMKYRPVAKHTPVTLPAAGPGIHLLHIVTRHSATTVTMVQGTGNQTMRMLLPSWRPSRSAAIAGITDTMVFSKDGYQTKKVVFDSDSLENEVIVNLAHLIGDYLFMDTVRSYRLTIAESDMSTLLDYSTLSSGPGQTNPVYVPAHLSFENRKLDSIAVRFRGDQSLWDCITNGSRNELHYPQFGFGNDDVCAKFSFKFNFKKYKDDQRLYGTKNLNFRSMAYDPTKMHERLGFSFFDDMGIICPRTAFARLYVNDEYWGVFCVVEEIDGRFTKHRFPETGDGNLYKDLWPDSYTTDGMVLEALRTNEEEGNIGDFTSFRDAVTASTTADSNFLEVTGQLMDIPYLINYLVVDRAIMNFDGIVAVYSGSGYRMRHNYCWYRDLPSSPFILIPWDLDKIFLYPEPNFWTNNQPVGNNNVPNWNVITSDYSPIGCYFDPSTIAMNYLGSGPYYDVLPIDSDKFLRLFRNTTWDDFVSTGQRFLEEVFLQDTVDARLSRWRRQIAPAVGEDATIDSAAWEIMVDSLSHTIPLMREHFEMMLDTLIVISE